MNSEIIAIEPTLDINTEKKTINIRKDILAPMFGGPIVLAEGIIIGGISIVCGTVVAGHVNGILGGHRDQDAGIAGGPQTGHPHRGLLAQCR